MKRSVIFITCWFAVVILMVSCCPKNPALYSVKTAHGNTDWHIDTAEEFLTGKDMNGNTKAANHCPDSWTKTHMHIGLTNTNVYYYDRDVTPTGEDIDSSNGIDKPMLFFYAGHGEPTDFSTLGNDAFLTNMRLGNCNGSNDGTLRYYWQCSCGVFAHGPKTCAGTAYDYACPGDFDGSHDSDAMRNVFERWGSIIDPALRMACGSSTAAYCWDTETNKIWDNYNNKGFDIADSFIDGLHRYNWNTPLCITTGGLFVSSTPLFDSTFTEAPNPSGAYFHIQYLSNFATTAPSIIKVIIPKMIPIYELIPPPLPDPLRKYKLLEKDDWMYSTDEVKGRGPAVKVNLNSGAVYLFGEQRFDEKAKPFEVINYIRLAERFIEDQGLTEKKISKPSGVRMVIQRATGEGKLSDLQKFQKNVIITFKRQITLDGKTIPFVGEGGMISVQLNNDGTLFNASKVWRQIKGISKTTKAKTYEQAYNEATAKIKEKEAYKLSDWTWGYEEAAGNVKQIELKAIYIFNFLPLDPKRYKDYPPMIVKISAHIE